MKTLFSSVFLALFLSACGSTVASCSQDFWNGTIGTCLPDGWIVLTGEQLEERGVPRDVIVGFQAKDPVSGQFPTVTVTKEVLTQEVAADQYSIASIRSVSVLQGYELIDTKAVKIDEGTEVALHVFTAQPLEGEPQRRFYQLSTTHEKVGYTVTAAAPLSVEKELDAALRLILSELTFVGEEDGE